MSKNFRYSVYVYPEIGHGIKLVGPTHDFYKAFSAYSDAAEKGYHVKLFDDRNGNVITPRFEANKNEKRP